MSNTSTTVVRRPLISTPKPVEVKTEVKPLAEFKPRQRLYVQGNGKGGYIGRKRGADGKVRDLIENSSMGIIGKFAKKMGYIVTDGYPPEPKPVQQDEAA